MEPEYPQTHEGSRRQDTWRSESRRVASAGFSSGREGVAVGGEGLQAAAPPSQATTKHPPPSCTAQPAHKPSSHFAQSASLKESTLKVLGFSVPGAQRYHHTRLQEARGSAHHTGVCSPAASAMPIHCR